MMRIAILALGLGAGMLGGCRMAGADTVIVGDVLVLPGMREPTGSLTLDQSRTMKERPARLNLDRSDWSSMEILVPVDASPHRATFATAAWPRDSARGRGEHPTPLSALETPVRSQPDRFHEGWLGAGAVIRDLLGVPCRVYTEAVETSFPTGGFAGYQRRSDGAWLGEVLGVTGAPRVIDHLPTGHPGVVRRFAQPEPDVIDRIEKKLRDERATPESEGESQ
ncbi:MAG: hypothetical protein KF866_01550 [Phycisphaeraceae bacterium]|nr:hypothetical protein [Phycisphaeraceae bacterium]MCW5754973.1 hypothetical protein [Phycisphaeraceae bacterium]